MFCSSYQPGGFLNVAESDFGNRDHLAGFSLEISGILGIPLVNLTGCEIRFVFWLLRASGRVEPYTIS